MFEEYLKLGHKKFVLEAEKVLLTEALEKCKWNVTHTASLVRMGRTTLVMKAKRLGIKLKERKAK